MAKRKKKGKIKLSQRASVRKKGEGKDTIQKAPAQMPRDNGINMRIKIRRKQ